MVIRVPTEYTIRKWAREEVLKREKEKQDTCPHTDGVMHPDHTVTCKTCDKEIIYGEH